MKLFATEMLTLDGVYQGPGDPDEDRSGGFERGGWAGLHADEAMGPYLVSMFERADALLVGWRTFDIWEQYWPNHDENPFGHRINALPRYVPSSTRTETTWQNTHFIADDLEARVRELKAQPGGELQVHGSGRLLRWLLERDLVDELNLRVTPVILGDGMRLFPDKGLATDLELVDSQALPSGVILQTFRPMGRAKLEDAGGA